MRIPRWLAGLVVLWICAITAATGWGFRRLTDETKTREREACESALEFRAEQEGMWVRVLQRAGVDEPTIDILRGGYDSLPEPASCNAPEPSG